jgi:S-adenosylmethionine-diacylgycerolhomoserine-N-methlytransferase
LSLIALPWNEYAPKATFMDDVRTLSSMWFGKIQGNTHQDRLESFYKDQAELYDGYRARMLHARKPMMTRLLVERARKGSVVWVDLGERTISHTNTD